METRNVGIISSEQILYDYISPSAEKRKRLGCRIESKCGEIEMKENNVTKMAVYPRCGKTYYERPALLRVDNETFICPGCGTREAQESIDTGVEEQDSIMETIHCMTCNPR